jgi:hypothetical protein
MYTQKMRVSILSFGSIQLRLLVWLNNGVRQVDGVLLAKRGGSNQFSDCNEKSQKVKNVVLFGILNTLIFYCNCSPSW